jgi:hypothetical protein
MLNMITNYVVTISSHIITYSHIYIRVDIMMVVVLQDDNDKVPNMIT